MAGTNHTFSFWAKGETAGLTFGVTYSGGSAPSYVTKTIASDSDEWVKYEASFYSPGYLTVYYTFYNASNMGAVDFYVDGVQFEQVTTLDDSSTSLIETSGSAVSRVADECNGAGNEQVINSEEGVLFAEIKTFSESGSAGVISLNDGSNVNRVKMELDAGKIKVRIDTAAGQVVWLNHVIAITNYLKIGFAWKTDDYALWVNGVEVGTDTSGNSFPADTLDRLSFDRGDGNEVFFGKTKDIRVYNTALTDQELADLTS